MVEIYRTPDVAFDGLDDFAFKSNYIEWEGLRTHFIDEGPRDGPVALLLHGEPTWSYLYRKMIPPLVKSGYRCVAPDHIGFGRSDKVLNDEWYITDRHIQRLRDFIEKLNLKNITPFVQDWAGPIGLINVVDTPEKFERIVILNTWLHHDGFEYSKAIREWRSAATNRQWLAWTKHNLPCGAIVRRALVRKSTKPERIEAAYEAPFYGNIKSKAGARRFPWCIPFAEPEAGSAARQANAFEKLKKWKSPIHFIFGGNDRIFPPSWGREWSSLVPSSSFDVIKNAGHFCQEDAGEEIVSRFLELCKKRPI